jgi:transcriptional regulator with XRE-family HTH domain
MAVAEGARTCACGCGGIPNNPRSRFLPGHYARVAPRGPGGGSLATLERGLCECDCGERVLTLGARFRHGHNARSAEWQERDAALRGRRRTRICRRCDRPYEESEKHGATRRYCSRWCATAAKRPEGWNHLQGRCSDWMVENRASMTTFAREVGVSRQTLGYWYTHKDSTIWSDVLFRLADFFRIPRDQAIREAGGKTAEQRRAEHALGTAGNFLKIGPAAQREVARKGGLSHRGGRQSPEWVAKRIGARMASDGYQRNLKRFTGWSRSDAGRAVHVLIGRLQHIPSPSRQQLSQWAGDTGQRLSLPPAAVLAIWKPYCQERGLVGTGGAPLLEDRHRLIVHEMASWPRTPSGRLQRGFWQHAADEVTRAEQPERPWSYLRIKRWWLAHIGRCPNTYPGQMSAA